MIMNMYLHGFSVIKKSRDDYVARLNGIYQANLAKVFKDV